MEEKELKVGELINGELITEEIYNEFANGRGEDYEDAPDPMIASAPSSGFSNSPMVVYTRWSPNYSSRGGRKIDTITIHHMAGNLSLETCGNIFAGASRNASATYAVDNEGRVGQYVDEKYAPWTTSSYANDSHAVTIEVANSYAGGNWPVSDTALNATIKLVADICKRNGIEKLNYTGDVSGNMTKHCWFDATACVPTYSEVLTKTGWVKISDIEIGDEIACTDLDNLNVTFEQVYSKVPVKQQDTYTNHGFTATKDHRMVYGKEYNKTYLIDTYGHLLDKNSPNKVYIPLAGNMKSDGLNMTDDMLVFYMAVQADGHYMYYGGNDNTDKRYYGINFHFSKERKITRIKEILEAINLPYKESKKSDGTISINVYNFDDIDIVHDICEKYLENKCFTWEWLNLSEHQAEIFFAELMFWDGCEVASKYTSHDKINLDIVNAIAATHGVGSRVVGTDVLFRKSPFITLTDKTRRNNRFSNKRETEVTCVSVKTGIFICRQNGMTFVIGNCPGPYLGSKFPYIEEQVNLILNPPKPKPNPVIKFDRIWGTNRYETAKAAANAGNTGGKFDSCILVSGENFADALSSGFLHYRTGGPILLINNTDTVIDKVLTWVKTNVAKESMVYIVGGKGVIPESVETKLEGYRVTRFAGSNRYKTNISVLKSVEPEIGSEIIVCNGTSFADGICASIVNKPVMLVANKLIKEQLDWLKTVSIKKFYLIGGESVVSKEVEAELAKFGSVERVYGSNRYSTAVAIANKFFKNVNTVIMATGKSYADGLCSVNLGRYPLLLVDNDTYKDAQKYVSGINIKKAYVMGGTGTITNETVNWVLTKI